jgi:hypothetical protein
MNVHGYCSVLHFLIVESMRANAVLEVSGRLAVPREIVFVDDCIVRSFVDRESLDTICDDISFSDGR